MEDGDVRQSRLYIIMGMVGLLLLAILLGTTITIPWFIFIPLIIIAFVIAASKSKRKDDD